MKRIHLAPALAALFALSIAIISCNAPSDGYDPKGAESIYDPDPLDAERYAVNYYTDASGFTCKTVEPLGLPQTYYCALYTPADNLKMVLSGCSECASINGYKIEYDKDGLVSSVTQVQGIDVLEDEPHFSARLLRSWAKDPTLEGERFVISRDEQGKITFVGDIDVPYDYTAHCFIREWGPFWYSDISGGDIGFFVLLEKDDKEDRSTVDYLYVDGILIAELAYWNGKFIKALYYNREGRFFGIDENRDADVLEEAHDIHDVVSQYPWYLD